MKWDKMDQSIQPDAQQVAEYVQHPLWADITNYLQQQYKAQPVFEYSRCSVPGWNMKYTKGGRALCRLYPQEGGFIALVVIGEREKEAFLQCLPTLTPYTQQLYEEKKDKRGLFWLMMQVTDGAILGDVKHCMALRRPV
ncbi:DUF3788 domain-containing protein [Eubacteriales bacterium OttesenSCG-928-N14]|nr:DUF3788 domain-containing protein [Eubacteriales bacterium OttesenSCG-928-N14]